MELYLITLSALILMFAICVVGGAYAVARNDGAGAIYAGILAVLAILVFLVFALTIKNRDSYIRPVEPAYQTVPTLPPGEYPYNPEVLPPGEYPYNPELYDTDG